MSFKEYLPAIEPDFEECISSYGLNMKLPLTAHKRLLKRQSEFFFTGCMSEAVAAYKETSSITEVSGVHRSIAETYEDDSSKYARQKEWAPLQRIFRYIPRMIGKKIKCVNISKEHRLLSLPLYMVEELPRLIDQVTKEPVA